MQPAARENGRLDPEELEEWILFTTTYTFSHFSIGMASIYFDGIRIQLLKNINKMCTELAIRYGDPMDASLTSLRTPYLEALYFSQGEDLITSINRVLQCAEYFSDGGTKLTVPSTFMFPFHVSFSALCRLNDRSEKGIYRRQIKWVLLYL